MATVLTWLSSGVGTKTGTTLAAFITDVVALFNSYSSNPNYLWQVASSSTAGNPHWIVLKRKSGAAGRILIVAWTSAPAGNNAAILDTTPNTNNIFLAWFPNGNVDTPSNLTAASGTIMGNDTGVVKCVAMGQLATLYGASRLPFYFESAEAVWFGFSTGGGTTVSGGGAGDILIDGAGNAYGGVYGVGSGDNLGTFGSTTSPLPWGTTSILAGDNTAACRTNYGAANRLYFHAYAPSGAWANSAVGASDILTETSSSKAWFVPVLLLSRVKGEGFVLRLRQVAMGPGTVGPFTTYNTTGPVVAARQFCSNSAGGNGFPWMANFEV